MGWHIVQKLLEQTAEHSTLIGKLWVTSFFVIRMLIVASMAGSVWGDALKQFVCNTQSPGCKNVCFNEYSPIALIRFWSLQLVCVALPSIIFIVYTAHKMAQVDQVFNSQKARRKAEKEMRKKIKEEEEKAEIKRLTDGKTANAVKNAESDSDDDDGMIVGKLTKKSPSKLFLVYFFVVVTRLLIEIGFMVGQYFTYPFTFVMPELYQCQHYPCPNVVDCFVSRPKEKTVFICLFYTTGCILILLNLLELYHISGNFSEAWKERDDDITKHANDGLNFGHGGGYDRRWPADMDYIEEELHGFPDTTGMPMIYRERRGRRHRGGRRY